MMLGFREHLMFVASQNHDANKDTACRVGTVDILRWTIVSSCLISLGASNPLHEQRANHGAVASESTICSNIGIELLKRGGNAADALVGTTLCVGVIGMYHSGIGGGGFMLVRDSNGQYEAIDFRETAPAAAYQDMYENYTIGSIKTGLASGVPGEIAGLEYLHNKYGLLPWEIVVHPAVHVARNGFEGMSCGQ